MKRKIVGMRELEAFSDALSKFVEENGKLRKAVEASHAILLANQAAGNLDAALAVGIAVGTEAPKAFEALAGEFETAVRGFLGEARRDCETPAEYFNRITVLGQAEIFRLQARNGITFLPRVK